MFLYISKTVEFEIKNTLIFTLTPQKMKQVGINLTKYMHDPYEEYYKTNERSQIRTKEERERFHAHAQEDSIL